MPAPFSPNAPGIGGWISQRALVLPRAHRPGSDRRLIPVQYLDGIVGVNPVGHLTMMLPFCGVATRLAGSFVSRM